MATSTVSSPFPI
jgi:D-lactate dehydrogenase (cytochrome)